MCVCVRGGERELTEEPDGTDLLETGRDVISVRGREKSRFEKFPRIFKAGLGCEEEEEDEEDGKEEEE